MAFFTRLSLKTRLLALLLGVSLGSLLTAGIFSWLRFRSTFQTQMLQQLTSVRAAKADQVETYLRDLQSQVETLSEDRMIVAAMVELNTAYKDIQNKALSPRWSERVEEFYEEEFFPRLSEVVPGEKIYANYRPTTKIGQYLQYYYIADNPAPIGEKEELEQGNDGSEYSKLHAKYHPLFENLVVKFGYDDLLLIDFDTGDIIYSVDKDVDFATNLGSGPYRRSNLAAVVEAVRANPGRRIVQVVDFKPYAPSYAIPSAFYAAPIYNGPHVIGILTFQVPVDRLNVMMTGNQEWRKGGLGETGEVYLVGADLLMRSVSRTLLEDPEQYEANLRQSGISAQTIEQIQRLNSSVLLQPVETESAQLAIAGNVGTTVLDSGYQGISVLSSYGPLRINGLDWAIIAEINRSEAFLPVYTLQAYLLVIGVILGLLIAWIADLAIQTFTQPVQVLNESVKKIREGKQQTLAVQLEAQNEFGEIAQSINQMIEDLADREQQITEQQQQNDALLANMLPISVIEQLKMGEQHIVDQIQQTTVVFARIVGISELTQSLSVSRSTEIFNRLVDTFDQLAIDSGLERQAIIGESYMAVCGLSRNYLDHQERAGMYTLQMIDQLKSISEEYDINLTLKVGVHSGSLVAGIVGSQKFVYNIWGTTIKTASWISYLDTESDSSSVLVTQAAYDRLYDDLTLVPYKTIELEEVGVVETYRILIPGKPQPALVAGGNILGESKDE